MGYHDVSVDCYGQDVEHWGLSIFKVVLMILLIITYDDRMNMLIPVNAGGYPQCGFHTQRCVVITMTIL